MLIELLEECVGGKKYSKIYEMNYQRNLNVETYETTEQNVRSRYNIGRISNLLTGETRRVYAELVPVGYRENMAKRNESIR